MSGLFGGGASKPQPIDYAAQARAATDESIRAYKAQLAAQIAAYPQLEALQLGTVSKIGGNLNNAYTQQAKGVIDQTLQQGATSLTDTGNRINALGDASNQISGLAGKQAMDNLALGTSLNPEEERAASQQASAAFASRGLGTGNSAAAADLLNRYQYGQQRYQQRLANAGAAQGMIGNTANLYGQAGGAYQNAAQLGFGGANALVNLDPYQRALGTGVQLGSGIQGQSGSMIGNTYNQNMQMAGDVASFNTNMQASMYNSAKNNNASMLGAGIGAAGSIAGAGIIAL